MKEKSLARKIFSKVIMFIAVIALLIVFFPNQADGIKHLITDKINQDKLTVNNVRNKYYVDTNFAYYQNTDIINPKNEQDLLNSFRTITNAGLNKFSFYCNKEYENCLSDTMEFINGDNITPYEIETFNHPFNDYSKIEISYSESLKHIEVKTTRKYTDEQIKEVEKEVDKLYKELYKPEKSLVENIRTFNNYIIEHTEYDQKKADGKMSDYASDTAYGVLIEGYGICGGYTDAMYLFLEKLGALQFRIVNETHTWNVVNIDGQWLHLDVTWNDIDGYANRFFLISTEKLWKLDTESHLFNQDVYIEAN